MTLRINLLPHRERTRKERREQFFILIGLIFILSVVMVAAQIFWKSTQINTQRATNAMLKSENEKLDLQIVEIAKLKEEIEALRARQKAVEDLQVGRNQPVRVFDELVRQIPEGAYLKTIKQDGNRITLVGLAQSQERVSEILRNVSNQSTWLESPDLIEIKSVVVGQNAKDSKDARKIFEFAMTVGVRDKPATLSALPNPALPVQSATAVPSATPTGPVPANAPVPRT